MITDAIGRAVAFVLAPGQAHKLPHAVALLDRLPDVPKWVAADCGYSSHAFREYIWNLGARPAIPPRQNKAPVACPDWIASGMLKRSASAAPDTATGIVRLARALGSWQPVRHDNGDLHPSAVSLSG